MTKKQYSKPQLLAVGDAVQNTLGGVPEGIKEFRGRRRRLPPA